MYRRKALNYILLFVIVLLQATACKKENGSPEQPPGNKQEDVVAVGNAVNEFMTKYNVPGMSVAIIKGEKLVYVKGYGLADKEKNQPVSINSFYE